MAFIPKQREIYKHFKGNLYQVIEIAEHTETGEQLVIYQALYGDLKTYARPLAMFTGRVDKEKYPDVAQEFRFELQGPESERQKKESGTGEAQAGPAAAELPETAAEPVQSAAKLPETAAESVQSTAKLPETAVEPVQSAAPGEHTEGELTLDPLLLEFLDADSYEQRLNILAGLHHRITDDMITTMAIACDVEISDGDTEERYEALKTCLLTLEKYECNRIR